MKDVRKEACPACGAGQHNGGYLCPKCDHINYTDLVGCLIHENYRLRALNAQLEEENRELKDKLEADRKSYSFRAQLDATTQALDERDKATSHNAQLLEALKRIRERGIGPHNLQTQWDIWSDARNAMQAAAIAQAEKEGA